MLVYCGGIKESKTLRILGKARLGWKANMAGDSPDDRVTRCRTGRA